MSEPESFTSRSVRWSAAQPSSIDVEGRHEFWQVMRGLAGEGKTVVFATPTSKRPTPLRIGSCSYVDALGLPLESHGDDRRRVRSSGSPTRGCWPLARSLPEPPYRSRL